jgi:hypothetical protein
VGVALGLLYDLIRPFRLHAPSWGEFLLDLFFWVVVTITIFVCAPLLGGGHVRLVMITNHLLGAIFYFKFISAPIRWFTTLIANGLSCVLSLLFWPFRTFLRILGGALSTFLSYFKKMIKKIFSFPSRWFTISKIPKEATFAAGQPSGNEEGQQHAQNKKGWSSD